MIVATAFASIGLFAWMFWLLGVAGAANGVLATTQGAFAVLRDENLDANGRERAMQQASLRLIADFASILGRSLLATVAAVLPVWAADAADLATAREVVGFLSDWRVVLVASGVMGVGYLARTRLWPSN